MNRLNLPKLSWMNRIGLAIGAVVAMVAGFAVATLLFIVLLAVGGAAAIGLWWTCRRLIKRRREADPTLLEGEYTVEPAQPRLQNQRMPAGRTRPNRTSRRGRPH